MLCPTHQVHPNSPNMRRPNLGGHWNSGQTVADSRKLCIYRYCEICIGFDFSTFGTSAEFVRLSANRIAPIIRGCTEINSVCVFITKSAHCASLNPTVCGLLVSSAHQYVDHKRSPAFQIVRHVRALDRSNSGLL